MIKRRQFLVGLGALFAAPAVCHASALMPLRGEVMLPSMAIPPWCPPGWAPANGHLVDRFQFPELHAWFKRTRQNGAHLGGQFRLPSGNYVWNNEYQSWSEAARRLQPEIEKLNTVEVPIISLIPMRRPSGQMAQPGMAINYVVNAKLVRADNPGSATPWRERDEKVRAEIEFLKS